MIKKYKQLTDFLSAQPAWAAFCNFLLIMVLFSLSRIFFYWVNIHFFPGISAARMQTLLKGGIQFDFSALIYINALYLAMQFIPFRFRSKDAYQTAARWIFMITNSIALIINCADIPFFRFTNRRTTCSIFSEFSNESSGSLFKIISKATVDYWYVTLFVVAAIVVMRLLYRTPRKTVVARSSGFVYYPLHILLLFLFGFYSVIGVRGGFGNYTRPITVSNANKYVENGTETAIVLNTPFCLLRTMHRKVYITPHYFDNEAAMTALYTPVHVPDPQGDFKPLNVVVLILESFGKEASGFFNPDLEGGAYRGFTPFLDSLYTQGLTFKYSYANGTKSIDAMPSILSSIPMFIEPFILTSYSTNDISSLADALKSKGYYSAFFHGAPNGSMGFQAYAKAAGFDDYFGYESYPDKRDFDGTWAIWDEEFLQFYADKMGKMKQPFITAVFTATSHHPFHLPERYKGKFPKGKHPILECIAYSDYAIRQFFMKMSKYDWYKNTLFVISADHVCQPIYDKYYTATGRYSIPILFYQPGSDLKGLVDSIPVEQADIMPTVLSYLNYDKPYFAYGQDILTTKAADKFVLNYNNGIYQLLKGDFVQQFDGEKTTAVYNFKTDSMLHTNLYGQTGSQEDNEELTKSVVQQYIMRMTENRLKVSKP